MLLLVVVVVLHCAHQPTFEARVVKPESDRVCDLVLGFAHWHGMAFVRCRMVPTEFFKRICSSCMVLPFLKRIYPSCLVLPFVAFVFGCSAQTNHLCAMRICCRVVSLSCAFTYIHGCVSLVDVCLVPPGSRSEQRECSVELRQAELLLRRQTRKAAKAAAISAKKVL